MIEFATALTASLVALAWALWTGRSLLQPRSLGRNDARLGSLRSILRALLGPSTRSLAVLAVLLAFLVFVGVGVVRVHTPADPARSALGLGAWLAATFLLGALVSAASAHLATASALRSFSPPASRSSTVDVGQQLLPASVFGAVVPASLALAALALLCVAALTSTGGIDARGAAAPVAAWRMAQLVVAFGAGSALGALFTRLVGGWFDVSLFAARAQEISDDAQRRSSQKLSDVVGFGAQSAVDLFGSWSVVGAVALIPCAAIASTHAQLVDSPIAVTLFPILVLGFALISSSVATMVLRSDDGEDANASLLRGLGVCVVLCSGSLLGLAHWLFDTMWTGPFAAAVGGVVAAIGTLALGAALGVRSPLMPSAPPMALAAMHVGRGFERAAGLLAIALLCFFGGAYLVGIGRLQDAGPYGSAAAVLGFMSPAPFLLVATGITSLPSAAASDTAPRGMPDRVRQRLTAARAAGGFHAYAATAALLAGMLAVQGYSSAATSYAIAAGTISATPPLASLGGASALAGLVLVLFVLGHLFGAAGRTARLVRLRGQDDAGVGSSVAESTALANGAVRQGITTTLVMLGCSAGAWLLVLAMAGRMSGQGAIPTTVAWMTLVVALGGAFSAALGAPRPTTGRSNAGEPSAPRKSAVDGAPDSANNLVHGAAVVSDTLGIPFGYVAGPALHALARLLPAVVVALAPLVH